MTTAVKKKRFHSRFVVSQEILFCKSYNIYVIMV